MHRRGFLATLGGVLAALGLSRGREDSRVISGKIGPPGPILFSRVHSANDYEGPIYPGKVIEWENELHQVIDHLRAPVGVSDQFLCPMTSEAWMMGDLWLNLDTRETVLVTGFKGDAVQVARAIGPEPAAAIEVDHVFNLVGNAHQYDHPQGQEYPYNHGEPPYVVMDNGVLHHINNQEWDVDGVLTEKQFDAFMEKAFQTSKKKKYFHIG